MQDNQVVDNDDSKDVMAGEGRGRDVKEIIKEVDDDISYDNDDR